MKRALRDMDDPRKMLGLVRWQLAEFQATVKLAKSGVLVADGGTPADCRSKGRHA